MGQNIDTGTLMTSATGNKQKSSNRLIITAVVACILAVCGIGFGIYGMMQSSQKDNQISDLKVQVKDSNGNITTLEAEKIETTDENGTTVAIVDSPQLSAEELYHYIYIAQWGIKIALPTSLGGFSYRYYMMPRYTSLEVAGTDCSTQGQCQYAPEFSNLSKTNFSLGTINRFYKGTEPPVGSGQKVFTIDNHDYYYVHPQAVYSIDSNEITWEVNTVNLIKEILTNPDNYSAI